MNLWCSEQVQQLERHRQRIVAELFNELSKAPHRLIPLEVWEPLDGADTAARRVCDYIAGSCHPSPRFAAPTSELAEPPAAQVERS